MKQFLLLFCLTLTISVSAQKANFSTSNVKEKNADNTVTFNCTITSLQSSQQVQTISTSMKRLKPVVKVDISNVTPTQADFKITTVKEDNVHTLQNALAAANIQDFTIDGKAYKVVNLYDVMQSIKKKK